MILFYQDLFRCLWKTGSISRSYIYAISQEDKRRIVQSLEKHMPLLEEVS